MTAHTVRTDIAGTRTGASDTRQELLGGARAMLPWLVGVIPFGVVIGVTIAGSSLSWVTGWATGPIIYGGSAQLTTVQLLDQGAAPLTIVLTVLIINARLIAYSGAVAVHWRGTRLPFRALGAYLLVDPSFAVGMSRYQEPEGGRPGHAHYLGGAVTLWIAWQTAILAGLTVGSGLPSWLHLEFVVPLFLVAEVVHRARSRELRAAAVVGGAIALAATSLPMHSGLIVAIASGIAAAVAVERLAPAEGSTP